ncbi:MAG TPA: isoprenylcysteine carboxylmethyltransferase family protein [Gemmatimonadales bacterium]|nr:isoprenylcysteine carboxylmethyltransferase family protein [Gemmatimonadales bacterium]
MSLKNASRYAIVLLMAAVLGLFLIRSLFADTLVFILLQAIGVLVMAWARLAFGLRSFHGAANPTAGGVVTTGPYAYIRHPIYAGMLLFLWAGVMAHPTLASAAFGLLATAAISLRIFAEERLIARRYPEYSTYRARTQRLIPFVF